MKTRTLPRKSLNVLKVFLKRTLQIAAISFVLLEGYGYYLSGLSEYESEKSIPGAFTALEDSAKISHLIDKMADFRYWGLISQLDRDMGDTLQRTGSYYVILKYLGAEKDDLGRLLITGYQHDIQQLTDEKGYYRRSNNPFFWGYDPDNCSRDQVFAAQSAIVYYRDFDRGQKLFQKFLTRAFLNQNTRDNGVYPWQEEYAWKFPDIPTPSQMALLLRGLGTWTVYPFIFALDSFILADVMYFRKSDARQLWDFDVKELPSLIAANSYLPTPWSQLGIQIYVKSKSDIIKRVFYYNTDNHNGIWPLAFLYKLTLDKLERQIMKSPSDRVPAESEISKTQRGPASFN